MAVGRLDPNAISLANGDVLVVGNDVPEIGAMKIYSASDVADDSASAEVWDHESGRWSTVASLNKPRADFVAVPLADGRVLVTGGVNAGDTEWHSHQSYSSTYIYDPRHPAEGWRKAAPLGTARTDPSAAVLPDGRVLVAGGYYLGGETGRVDSEPATLLAAYRPGATVESIPPAAILADTDGPTVVPLIATAELYDPVADRWSATGPMRYARHGAAAVTLSDGRVLVVGLSTDQGFGWNFTDTSANASMYAPGTAEIYDPQAGRFSLTGDLPLVDWSPLLARGFSFDHSRSIDWVVNNGMLVALADGGALLVGRTSEAPVTMGEPDAEGYYPEFYGYSVSTLRFDPATGQWTVIDESVYAPAPGTDLHRGRGRDVGAKMVEIVPGHSRFDSVAVTLPDGRVLVAGGQRPTQYDHRVVTTETTSDADLYDPLADSWTALPPMPGRRAGGAAVALADGSVFIVGGHTDMGSGGLPSAVRFVPEP
jgi:N-acetylneuraminic acid mutarotase